MSDCGKCFPCWLRRGGTRGFMDPSMSEPCMRPRSTDSHVRLWKRGGYWTVEMFIGDELSQSYIGEQNAPEAFERARAWLTSQEQKQLQASLARNQETRP